MCKRRLFLALVVLASSFIVAELAARVYLSRIPERLYIDLEGVPITGQVDTTWDDRGFYQSQRETLPHVEASQTLYMVGTSITQGEFARSSETIASYLQRRLRTYRVVNLGAPAQSSAGMRRQIKSLAVRRGDIVVMEGVSMDAESVFFSQEAQALKCAPLAIVRYLCLPRPNEYLNERSTHETLNNMRLARASVESRGAAFLYVIVPYFYSVEATADRERTIQAQYAPVVEGVYRSAWQRLYAAVVSEPCVLDLSRILDERRAAGKRFYRDIWHFDEAGDAIVARVIYDMLFEQYLTATKV
jgi:hypothetical protein